MYAKPNECNLYYLPILVKLLHDKHLTYTITPLVHNPAFQRGHTMDIIHWKVTVDGLPKGFIHTNRSNNTFP